MEVETDTTNIDSNDKKSTVVEDEDIIISQVTPSDTSSTTTTSNTTTSTSHHSKNRIKSGDIVILNINNGEIYKVIKLTNSTKITVGKKKNIDLKNAIGQPYFTTFNVNNGQLEKVNPKEMDQELLKITEISNNQDANNSTLTPYNTSQKLTGDDIKGLKEKGGDYKEVISALIDNSSSFHTKTAYSQVKYLKKKMAKHSTIIRIMKPSLKTLCETYYSKDPKKICNLRFDTFGQLLTQANIRAGAKVLVVETAMGIVTGAIAERMNGNGTVLSAFIGKGPSLSIAQNFGFEQKVENTIYSFSIELINKMNAVSAGETNPPTISLPNSTAGGVYNQNRLEESEPILKDGVNSLVIATEYHPLNILKACLPYLNPSGNIAIFSVLQEHLIECFQFLHQNLIGVNLSISEIWMREQQVLPKRTHPNMNMDGASGYLLSGIKVKNSLTTTPSTSSPTTTTTTTTTETTTATTTNQEQNSDIKMNESQDNNNQDDEQTKKRKRGDESTENK